MTERAPHVVVRPATLADAPALGRVQLESWRTTDGAHVKPQSWWAHFSYAEREAAWRALLTSERPVLALAAEAQGNVVGFAWCERNDGAFPAFEVELSAVHLLPAFQVRGIGQRLMQETARQLHLKGFRSLLLWTGLHNRRARAFYERLGGVPLAGEQATDLDGVVFLEVAYGCPT